MGDQKEDHGHHAITREAVRLLFEHRGVEGPDRIKRVDGMDELTYYHNLDKAQRDQDVLTPGKGEGIPTLGTSVPAAVSGKAQAAHAMADPNLSGQENLERDRQFVENHLNKAHDSRGNALWDHLGAATHALEDSYSEAHMWRGDAVNHGDPRAAIQSIHVWEPRGHEAHGKQQGMGYDVQGSHDHRFDEVPVEHNPSLEKMFKAPVPLMHASDRAAAAAVAEMLESFHDHHHDASGKAAAAHHETIGQFFQAEIGEQPKVNKDFGDPAWEAERDRRLAQNLEEEALYRQGIHEAPDDYKKHPYGYLDLGQQPHAAHHTSAGAHQPQAHEQHGHEQHGHEHHASAHELDPHGHGDHAMAHHEHESHAGYATYDPHAQHESHAAYAAHDQHTEQDPSESHEHPV